MATTHSRRAAGGREHWSTASRTLRSATWAVAIGGTALDLAAVARVASQLDAKATTLEERLGDVAREGREAQLTLTEKQRALAEHDVVFSGVATTLTGLFTLAGLPELAARVRPSRRHAGRTEEEEAE